jgi:hypothetical protein
MNGDLERVRSLLERAAHPETPEEEARTCAVIAARLIHKNGFVVSKLNTNSLKETITKKRGPINWENVPRAKVFRRRCATTQGYCNVCNAYYEPGEEICMELNGGRITCIRKECMRTWITI